MTWSKWSVAAPMPHPLPPVNLSLSLPTSVNVTALLGPSLAAPLDSLLAAAAAISINLTSSLASSGLGSHGEPLLYGNASQPPTSPSALLPALDLLASSLSETITGSAAQAQVQIRTLLSQLPAFQGLGGGGGASEHGQGQGREAGSEAAALRAGQQMARRGYKAKHPVVIVPGEAGMGNTGMQGRLFKNQSDCARWQSVADRCRCYGNDNGWRTTGGVLCVFRWCLCHASLTGPATPCGSARSSKAVTQTQTPPRPLHPASIT